MIARLLMHDFRSLPLDSVSSPCMRACADAKCLRAPAVIGNFGSGLDSLNVRHGTVRRRSARVRVAVRVRRRVGSWAAVTVPR